MVLEELQRDTASREAATAALGLMKSMYPVCRSITGNGVRETLQRLRRIADIEIREVASGTPVFDWTIPDEWNLREAYIADADGHRVVDAARCNLHVMAYSVPVRARLPLPELKRHIHTLPDQPSLIPYRTSYYARQWAFCMTHEALLALPEGEYEVVIDATLAPGHLAWGELLIPGASEDEVLLSAHVCHPSLANDNCSGLALLAHLARRLADKPRRLSYRILFAPGTIGAIAWLAQAGAGVRRIRHGLVLSCVGDSGGPHYKRSRRGNAAVDRAMAHVLARDWPDGRVMDFSPYGYDERQYCSPGFDLPVGLFQRSRFGAFPEYHTSGDNLAFITPADLEGSFRTIAAVIDILERDRILISTNPFCEPQLGRRGLYHGVGGDKDAADRNMAMLWVMNLADGAHSLLDMAQRSGCRFTALADAAERLEAAGLLVPAGSGPPAWRATR